MFLDEVVCIIIVTIRHMCVIIHGISSHRGQNVPNNVNLLITTVKKTGHQVRCCIFDSKKSINCLYFLKCCNIPRDYMMCIKLNLWCFS